MSEDDDVLLKKLTSIKKAFSIIIDAKHAWMTDPNVQPLVQKLNNERLQVIEHSQSLLLSQLKAIIPASMLSMDHQYLVDLKKLAPPQAEACKQVFEKVEQYRIDRIAEIDLEERKLAQTTVAEITAGSADKIATLIAQSNFMEMKALPDQILQGLITSFNEAEALHVLKHSGGPCLTLLKAPSTLTLTWQPAMLI
jgi:6-pyruvoyl-tetrahydropterin synthase